MNRAFSFYTEDNFTRISQKVYWIAKFYDVRRQVRNWQSLDSARLRQYMKNPDKTISRLEIE
jgi:hypothetical protein